MDIDAKHSPTFISSWTYSDVKTKLWNITPLSDMWGIGKRMEKNLNSSATIAAGNQFTFCESKTIHAEGDSRKP